MAISFLAEKRILCTLSVRYFKVNSQACCHLMTKFLCSLPFLLSSRCFFLSTCVASERAATSRTTERDRLTDQRPPLPLAPGVGLPRGAGPGRGWRPRGHGGRPDR